jgi:hypothetical protein
MDTQDTQRIIDRLGGTTEAAGICEVTPGAVSQWLKNGIPPARLMYLKAVRPDAFEEERPDLSSSPAAESATTKS